MAPTKADRIETIQANNGQAQIQSTDRVETTITKDILAAGDDILISGFGKFPVKEMSERKGRNSVTGEDFMAASKEGCDVQVLW